MGVRISEGFTFDDVLLRPLASAIEPKDAQVGTTLGGVAFAVPFLSAAMDRVTEAPMAIALGKLGGLGVLHRNCTAQEQVEMVKAVKKYGTRVGAACGPFDITRAKMLDEAGCDFVIIDCAHGHNLNVMQSAKMIKRKLRRAKMIFGNIATAEAAKAACEFADAVKVGVGPGSICTTRIVSGVGVPQLTAIMEVASVASRKKVAVIADGGLRSSGDVVKALAAGASAIMSGNLFAGCDETPGEFVEKNGKKLKEYRGMGSAAVIKSRSGSERYLTAGRKAVAEGIEAHVAAKGPLADTVATLVSGLQVGMGYVGARTIRELQQKAQFIRVTGASVLESRPHSLLGILE